MKLEDYIKQLDGEIQLSKQLEKNNAEIGNYMSANEYMITSEILTQVWTNLRKVYEILNKDQISKEQLNDAIVKSGIYTNPQYSKFEKLLGL